MFSRQERKLVKRNRRFIVTDKKVVSSSDSDQGPDESHQGLYIDKLQRDTKLRLKKMNIGRRRVDHQSGDQLSRHHSDSHVITQYLP